MCSAQHDFDITYQQLEDYIHSRYTLKNLCIQNHVYICIYIHCVHIYIYNIYQIFIAHLPEFKMGANDSFVDFHLLRPDKKNSPQPTTGPFFSMLKCDINKGVCLKFLGDLPKTNVFFLKLINIFLLGKHM